MPFVYKGIGFPFRRGATEFPQSASDATLIKESLVQLVMTGQGERVMRPQFGTRVLAYVFDNTDIEMEMSIRREIASVIAKNEPRVRTQGISLVFTDTTVDVLIEYLVVATNENQTLTLTLGAL